MGLDWVILADTSGTAQIVRKITYSVPKALVVSAVIVFTKHAGSEEFSYGYRF